MIVFASRVGKDRRVVNYSRYVKNSELAIHNPRLKIRILEIYNDIHESDYRVQMDL